MTNNFTGIIAILALSIPGFFINLTVLGRKRPAESLALSWLTGSVVVTLALYALNTYLNIGLNPWVSVLTFMTVTFISLLPPAGNLTRFNLYIKNFFKTFREKITPIKAAGYILTILLLVSFITSFFFPVADWDAITVFDFRAKILFNEGVIKDMTIMTYAGYPMYTSLLHYWAYLTGLWTAMPVYPLFTASFAAGIYFVLKRFLTKPVSLLITIACLAAPRIFANTFIAYTNLPYTVFLILGALYIYLWTEERDWRDLLMGIILSAATFWVRSFPFAVVNFGLVFLAIPFIKKYAKYLSLLTIGAVLVLYFLPVTHAIADYLKWAVYEYYSPYWVVFIAFFLSGLFSESKNWFWILAYTGYGLVLLAGTFVFNQKWPGYYQGIYDAVRRMMIFINPAIILAAISIFPKQILVKKDA